MTGKADFSPEEWEVVLKGPPSAGMIVVTAQRGGTFRESFSMAKAYAEARQQHGESQLLDTIVSTKPEVDKTRPLPRRSSGGGPPAPARRGGVARAEGHPGGGRAVQAVHRHPR